VYQKGLWIGEVGQTYCYAVAYDGVYIYAGLYTSPAKVIKIDPATMTTVDSWSDGSTVLDLHVGGDYFYAGLNISPARVYQFGTEAPAASPKAVGSIPHRLVAAGLI
jgi:hypothetical protein